MSNYRVLKYRKKYYTIAKVLVLVMLFQCFSPIVTLALTNGPSSPEFSKFEPVSTSNMVNLFTGDFTYNLPVINIPGPDGAGYSLSLSYQSGVNAEQEASWVGFGWTLNPGAINRFVKGIPDDYDGSEIKKYNKARANWSISGYTRLGTELFGKNLGINGTKSIRINNYSGLYSSYGLGLSLKGVGSLNFNKDASGITAKASISPDIFFKRDKDEADEDADSDQQTLPTFQDLRKANDVDVKYKFKIGLKGLPSARGVIGSNFNFNNLVGGGDVIRSQNFNKYWGIGFNFNMSVQPNPSSTPVGVEKGFGASFNIQKNHSLTDHPAYGFMNNVNIPDLSEKDNILSDYHVEKSSPYTKRDFHLGIPLSDPDLYSLTGEGLGGSFRYWGTKPGHFLSIFWYK